MAVWGPTAIASDADDGNNNDSGTSFSDRAAEGYPQGEYFIVRADPGSNNSNWGCLRFINVAVPAGATINEAVLRIWIISGDASTDVIMTVFADVGANRQAALSNSHNALAGWTNSTAYVTANALSAASPREIEITSIVQELVDLAGWSSGDNLCLSLDPEANTIDTYWGIQIADYDADTLATVATLEIDYTEAGSGVAKSLGMLLRGCG
jgi:hypothetical protein